MLRPVANFEEISVEKVHLMCQPFEEWSETGSVMYGKTPVRQRTGRSLENIAAVNESVAENPKISIRHRYQQLHI